MFYINLDWDWLTSNSCKLYRIHHFRDTLYVASVAEKWLP